MFTLSYRSYAIQGYLDKTDCYVYFNNIKFKFKSLLACKQFITRQLRIDYGYSTMSEQNKRIYGFKS